MSNAKAVQRIESLQCVGVTSDNVHIMALSLPVLLAIILTYSKMDERPLEFVSVFQFRYLLSNSSKQVFLTVCCGHRLYRRPEYYPHLRS